MAGGYAMTARDSNAPRRCGGSWVPAREVEAHLFNGWSLANYEANPPCQGCALMCALLEPPAIEQERAA